MDLLPHFQKNKLLKEVSTFAIGGPARLFTEVRSPEEMARALKYCHKQNLPFFILGKGSNCLFDDRGFDGVVIQSKISYLNQEQGEIEAGSGYSFSLLGVKSARAGFSGLEFASGIPATVGGAVFMNAGANGHETKDFLVEVGFVTEEGELVTYKKEELEFAYRYSSFQKKRGAIVFARFELTPSSTSREMQLKIIEYRTKTQPYHDPSIGCIFRNPKGGSAGALIEESGLKGVQIGEAMISDKHANFIVNKGNAKAEDVRALVSLVKATVSDKAGVSLEEEMRCVPYQVE